jgi:hypothetical protein
VSARRGSQVDRFHPAIEAYLVAVGFGLLGVAIGAVIATDPGGAWWGRLRGAHLLLNVLGLVGITVAGTLPYFVATQARMRMAPLRPARPAASRSRRAGRRHGRRCGRRAGGAPGPRRRQAPRLRRSWPGLVLANVAAGALLVDLGSVALVAGSAWALDTGWRAVRLLTDDGGVEQHR